MNLKTYQASSMAKALLSLRRELGSDAVILNTRTFKKGSWLGVGGRQMVEITATTDVNVLSRGQREPIMSSRPTTTAGGASRFADARTVRRTRPPARQWGGAQQLRSELTLVREMVQDLVSQNRKQQHPSVPEELLNTYLALINQEVAAELAGEIVNKIKSQLSSEQLSNQELVRRKIAGLIETMVPAAERLAVGQPGKPRIVAMIGPTGVGKTTTIAKLAANFKLREGKSVGLITIDTYRIAAVDQLRTYANIIDVPLRVVLTPTELRDAIDSMRGAQLILIDTAGRGQNDQIKLRELKSFLDAAGTDEIHLVLSTTCSRANLLAALEKFSQLGIDRIIFTKLDEAVGVGMLLDVIRKVNTRLSYFTTGQNVPDDIEPGTGRYLARLILHPDRWPGADQRQIPAGLVCKGGAQ